MCQWLYINFTTIFVDIIKSNFIIADPYLCTCDTK